MDIGDAYYSGDPFDFQKTVPAGRYTAIIRSMDVNKDVQFGQYIADVFKPEYEIDAKEHPEYTDCFVKDNGIFRYKQSQGFVYEIHYPVARTIQFVKEAPVPF